jgi:hypothetical protein
MTHFLQKAVVCKNSQGKIISATSQINPTYDPNTREALAALLAAKLVLSHYLKCLILEGDSLVVISHSSASTYLKIGASP